MQIDEMKERIERISEMEKPENPKFSVSYMAPNEDPTSNFYQYCNGNWIATHPIPEDKIRWGAFMEIAERNRYVLGKILEECAFSERWDDKTIQQLGSFYLSAMDTEKIDELKFEPINL